MKRGCQSYLWWNSSSKFHLLVSAQRAVAMPNKRYPPVGWARKWAEFEHSMLARCSHSICFQAALNVQLGNSSTEATQNRISWRYVGFLERSVSIFCHALSRRRKKNNGIGESKENAVFHSRQWHHWKNINVSTRPPLRKGNHARLKMPCKIDEVPYLFCGCASSAFACGTLKPALSNTRGK